RTTSTPTANSSASLKTSSSNCWQTAHSSRSHRLRWHNERPGGKSPGLCVMENPDEVLRAFFFVRAFTCRRRGSARDGSTLRDRHGAAHLRFVRDAVEVVLPDAWRRERKHVGCGSRNQRGIYL